MNQSQDQTLIVMTTVPDDEAARQLALSLIEQRLAACAQVVGGMTSFYRWKGALQQEGEVLVLIKTVSSRYQALAEALTGLHPYEVPEIVAIAAERVSPEYDRWVRQSLDLEREDF